MPEPKAKPIELTQLHKTILERIIAAHNSPQQLVKRCRIIVAANEKATNEQIATTLGVTRNTVRTWRNRWADAAERLANGEKNEAPKVYQNLIVDLLRDKPRSGIPPLFSAEQICQIVALACEDPSQSGRPITHWTPKELADEAIKRDIVGSISPRHIGRFLKSVRP